MFNKEEIKSNFEKLKPNVMRSITTGVQGYIFGAMVGIFTFENGNSRSKPIGVNDFLLNMHKRGVTFAKVGLIYSSTECVIEGIRDKKCPWNSAVSGAVAGAIMGRKNRIPLMSAIAFGTYSGITDYNKQE